MRTTMSATRRQCSGVRVSWRGQREWIAPYRSGPGSSRGAEAARDRHQRRQHRRGDDGAVCQNHDTLALVCLATGLGARWRIKPRRRLAPQPVSLLASRSHLRIYAVPAASIHDGDDEVGGARFGAKRVQPDDPRGQGIRPIQLRRLRHGIRVDTTVQTGGLRSAWSPRNILAMRTHAVSWRSGGAWSSFL